MELYSAQEPRMDTSGVYLITVRGALSKHWAEWFNGTFIAIERSAEGNPKTKLTCKVRDQAELFGILNRLNSLNLPLLNVTFLSNLAILEEVD